MAETTYLSLKAYGFGEKNKDTKDNAPLSWRLAGSDSLSDWTIVVKRSSADMGSGESIDSASYHVHKNILAVGPRRSEYFVKLFKNGHDVLEIASSTSTIELESSAADAFPTMLDYLYSHKEGVGKELGISTINAVALRHLAQYFRINGLFCAVTEFIRDDLVPSTAPTYFSESVIYGDEMLAKAAEEMCAQYMADVGEERFNVLAPELMRRIFSSGTMKCGSLPLSKIVSAYCEARHEVIDGDLFQTMTNAKFLPRIEPDAALPLLKALVSLSSEEVDTQAKDSGAARSLKARCVAALSGSWSDKVARPLLEEAKTETTDEASRCKKKPKRSHGDLPASIQIDILESSLCAANCDVSKKKEEIQDFVESESTLQAKVMRLERAVDTIRQREADIRQSSKFLQSDLQAQVARLEKEVASFVPVPEESMHTRRIGFGRYGPLFYKKS